MKERDEIYEKKIGRIIGFLRAYKAQAFRGKDLKECGFDRSILPHIIIDWGDRRTHPRINSMWQRDREDPLERLDDGLLYWYRPTIIERIFGLKSTPTPNKRSE